MANEFHGSSLRSSSPNNPKFIQIITSLDELSRLRIPVVFAKKNCEKMLNPVFLEAPHGKAWEVEVENYQGQIWLAKGWNEQEEDILVAQANANVIQKRVADKEVGEAHSISEKVGPNNYSSRYSLVDLTGYPVEIRPTNRHIKHEEYK
uniref:TF-B3 domain-containing protein n=1 Tax=Solanum lycopersicum TaxID=4081 RepID=A0A3Q7FGB4_SOLLC